MLWFEKVAIPQCYQSRTRKAILPKISRVGLIQVERFVIAFITVLSPEKRPIIVLFIQLIKGFGRPEAMNEFELTITRLDDIQNNH